MVTMVEFLLMADMVDSDGSFLDVRESFVLRQRCCDDQNPEKVCCSEIAYAGCHESRSETE
jgi:hypothetical protein